jgi:hypothetical protein
VEADTPSLDDLAVERGGVLLIWMVGISSSSAARLFGAGGGLVVRAVKSSVPILRRFEVSVIRTSDE